MDQPVWLLVMECPEKLIAITENYQGIPEIFFPASEPLTAIYKAVKNVLTVSRNEAPIRQEGRGKQNPMEKNLGKPYMCRRTSSFAAKLSLPSKSGLTQSKFGRRAASFQKNIELLSPSQGLDTSIASQRPVPQATSDHLEVSGEVPGGIYCPSPISSLLEAHHATENKLLKGSPQLLAVSKAKPQVWKSAQPVTQTKNQGTNLREGTGVRNWAMLPLTSLLQQWRNPCTAFGPGMPTTLAMHVVSLFALLMGAACCYLSLPREAEETISPLHVTSSADLEVCLKNGNVVELFCMAGCEGVLMGAGSCCG